MDEQIERIRHNLERVRNRHLEHPARDYDRSYHNFKLRPRVRLSEVVAYEERYGFSLPEAYRRFILELGDGGAGPWNGIRSLIRGTDPGMQEIEATCAALPTLITDDADLGETDWREKLLGPDWEELWEADENLFSRGTIRLSDEGCGHEIVLVVNGPTAGMVCSTDHGFSPPRFCDPPGFLDFYESWLNTVLRYSSTGAERRSNTISTRLRRWFRWLLPR